MAESPFVVGVDGSDPSLLAVDWAADEAARHGKPLRVIHASLWERYEAPLPSFSTDRPAEHVLAGNVAAIGMERARLRSPQLRVSSEVLPADPADALVSESATAFAVVVGARGRGRMAELLLGSVSLAVAARAQCPVIVVRGGEENIRGVFRRMVLGVGGSTDSSAAVRFACREAAVRSCELEAVRAWRRPAHQPRPHPLLTPGAGSVQDAEAAEALEAALEQGTEEHPSLRVLRKTVEGGARKVLLDEATRADLLVVGAMRRQTRFGLQLGRVSHALIHHAPCPVAVVPQPG